MNSLSLPAGCVSRSFYFYHLGFLTIDVIDDLVLIPFLLSVGLRKSKGWMISDFFSWGTDLGGTLVIK